ncbi:ketopantoate reductase family protein [Acidisphaera sp. L21]|uniref:ketopantoate reductase family protein n=1 Tax=Acidisphaera sp. L21 TaxID=1641851 RepID=UPI00131B0FC0|nr:2-dehydropantoate 2-reductase [Acidisphaera sp. L21]
MRVCIFGAGAIGGFIAGYMARAGIDVSVVARGAHLRAIQVNGLTVDATDERFTVKVRASDNPADLGVQDGVLVSVKAPALPQIAGMIAPLLADDTPVAFLNNGVPWWYFHGHGGQWDGQRLPLLDPDDVIWNAIGPRRTVGGIAWPASSVPEPGVIHVMKPKSRATVLGAPDGVTTPGILALEQAFITAGLPVVVETQIRDRIWEKIAFNLSAGPMCVLTETPVRATHEEEVLIAASHRLVDEAKALIKALGRNAVVDMDTILSINMSLGHRPSILQDLMARRPMEVNALYNVPLQLAKLTGTPMPTLEFLAALIRVRVKGLFG